VIPQAVLVHEPAQRVSVGVALFAQYVRVRRAENDVHYVRTLLDHLRQSVQYDLDPLARRQKAERQQGGAPLQSELILVETRVNERYIRNPVRDEDNLVFGNTVDIPEELSAYVTHDNEPVREFRQFSHNPSLAFGWLLQDRMQRCDDRHPEPPE